MRILFVSSGNYKSGISPIVEAQGNSLKEQGINVEFYTIKGKGVKGYIKSILPLRNYLKKNQFDLIHAHYSFSGYVAALAGVYPTVVSLMGCDITRGKGSVFLIRLFKLLFWKELIVKTTEMERDLGLKHVNVLPNGVDTNKYLPKEYEQCKGFLNWDKTKRHILFASDPDRPEKNYPFLQNALEFINEREKLEIHFLRNIPSADVPVYLNASDVVVLTSLREGSPNIIKEAMCCNRQIVSTSVGDVPMIIGSTEGCYISSFEPKDFAGKLALALDFSRKFGETRGRNRILELGLDSGSIAGRIITIYNGARANRSKISKNNK